MFSSSSLTSFWADELYRKELDRFRMMLVMVVKMLLELFRVHSYFFYFYSLKIWISNFNVLVPWIPVWVHPTWIIVQMRPTMSGWSPMPTSNAPWLQWTGIASRRSTPTSSGHTLHSGSDLVLSSTSYNMKRYLDVWHQTHQRSLSLLNLATP